MGIRVQEVSCAVREVEDSVLRQVLWEAKDDRHLVVTLGSGDRVYHSGHTLIPIISLTRACGENSILKKERLISGKPLFEKVGLPSIILTAKAVLMRDGVELLFSLRSNIVIQIPISNILAQIHFARMDCSGEDTVRVVNQDVTPFVRLHHRKEEHVLDVGGGHHAPTLAGWSHGSYADLFPSFCTDDGLSLMLIVRRVGVGDVRVEPVSEELLY